VIELLGLGEDFTAGGDPEIILREQLIHDRDIVGEDGLLPFSLEGDDLGAFDVLLLAVPAILG